MVFILFHRYTDIIKDLLNFKLSKEIASMPLFITSDSLKQIACCYDIATEHIQLKSTIISKASCWKADVALLNKITAFFPAVHQRFIMNATNDIKFNVFRNAITHAFDKISQLIENDEIKIEELNDWLYNLYTIPDVRNRLFSQFFKRK